MLKSILSRLIVNPIKNLFGVTELELKVEQLGYELYNIKRKVNKK